jgi:CBS domain-containing protein
LAVELEEIRAFIARHAPFGTLGDAQMARVVRAVQIQYFRRGTVIIKAGQENLWLSLIRSGAVELLLGGSDLQSRLGEGECFGYPSLMRDGPAQNQATALEDCLLYRIPKATFNELRARNSAFAEFFSVDESRRLRVAVAALRGSGQVPDPQMASMLICVKDILRRSEIVRAEKGDSIAHGAQIMTQSDVSTVLIYDSAALIGIVTDKDLRARVLGENRSAEAPLSEIMTPNPVTIPATMPIFSALLLMLERHIHHLPVTDATGGIIGVIGASDLLARMGSNTLQIANQVRVAKGVGEVARATARLAQAMLGLVDAGVDADHIGRFVSSIGEQAHARILSLAEADLGPPPVPYALVAFGSLARNEQALGSDQDNGFVLGAGYDAAVHDGYFSALAQKLCEGLDGAGYVYCPGNIMASNPAQRLSLADWQQNFAHWIGSPDPQAILNSTIFFDMRAVAGARDLVEDLRQHVFSLAKKNNIFQSFIARSAAGTRIPLGFFRNLVLEHDAVEGAVLDLKHQAIAPIVDIARAHALAGGSLEVNTAERLRVAAETGSLHPQSAADLSDCFEFVRDIRFRHQARQIKAGQLPTNKLSPESLSRFEREHLRDAFKIIRDQLDHLRTAMAGGIT